MLSCSSAETAPFIATLPRSSSVAGTSGTAFNYFFLPPLGTFTIAHPMDLVVLATFLVTSLVAAQLLYRANREAMDAQERATEIDRLAALGAESLNAADARDALSAIVGVIQSILGVEYCAVIEHPVPEELAETQDSERELLLPLRVRDSPVGALRIEDEVRKAVIGQDDTIRMNFTEIRPSKHTHRAF